IQGCTYARKNSELFLKYVRRIHTTPANTAEERLLATLDKLRERENQILQLWTKKKKQLDQCQQFVLLESSAKQVTSIDIWYVVWKHICIFEGPGLAARIGRSLSVLASVDRHHSRPVEQVVGGAVGFQ